MTTETTHPAAPPVGRAAGVLLSGRRVELERLGSRHMKALYRIATADEAADGWPLAGERVAEEEFAEHIWSLGRIQFAIVRCDSGDPIGLVQGVADDLRNGTLDVGLLVATELWRAGWPFEGVALFVDHLFNDLGYRKLYFSTPTWVRGRLGATLDALLILECTLTCHMRRGERYEDVSVFALHRDQWDTELFRRLTGRC